MSAAALFTAGSGSFFTPHSERLDALPPSLRVAASETWHAVVGLLHRGHTQTDERVTDRALAHKMGRSLRFVQKGLRALQDLEMIRRVRQFGRRIIIVLERLRGRDKPRAKTQADAKPTATKSAPIPNVGFVRPLTPEQIAAAQARLLAVQQAELPEPTPEEQAALDRFLEESRRRREAASRAKLRPKLVNVPRPTGPDVPGMTAQAALEARRHALGVPIAPDPAPGPQRPPRPADGT